MATEVIHEHTSGSDSSATGMIVGILLVIVIAIAVFYLFGSGLFRGFGGTTVQIPDKVNVNVQNGSK